VAHKELIVKLRQVTRLCEDMYVFLFPLFLIKFPVGFKPLLFHKKKVRKVTRLWSNLSKRKLRTLLGHGKRLMLPEHTTRKMKIKLQVWQVISKLGRSL
jgi:hypothetical protein